MPYSIPAYFALRFVKNSDLKKRINVLGRSYKFQLAGISLFSFTNISKLIAQPINNVTLLPITSI